LWRGARSACRNVPENSLIDFNTPQGGTWGALQAALQDAVENFKTEPPIAGLHGSDEGDYPYGEGLEGRMAKKVK